jgi:hypothetical protein
MPSGTQCLYLPRASCRRALGSRSPPGSKTLFNFLKAPLGSEERVEMKSNDCSILSCQVEESERQTTGSRAAATTLRDAAGSTLTITRVTRSG